MKNLKKLLERIENEHCQDIMVVRMTEGRNREFCFLNHNMIFINEIDYVNPTEKSLFYMLHEIGHLKTNKKGMLRWQEEASATQWAIDRSHEYGINISSHTKNVFERYIAEWVQFAISHRSKKIPKLGEKVLYW